MPDAGTKLVGRIGQQPDIPAFVMTKHREYFIELARLFVKNTSTFSMKVDIKAAWMVRMLEFGEYNPIHLHSNCRLSSIGFLKVPDNYDEAVRKDEYCGMLTFIGGPNMDFANGTLKIKPEVGVYYIFPWYLYHSVYPLGEGVEGERRSFSINYTVEEK